MWQPRQWVVRLGRKKWKWTYGDSCSQEMTLQFGTVGIQILNETWKRSGYFTTDQTLGLCKVWNFCFAFANISLLSKNFRRGLIAGREREGRVWQINENLSPRSKLWNPKIFSVIKRRPTFRTLFCKSFSEAMRLRRLNLADKILAGLFHIP